MLLMVSQLIYKNKNKIKIKKKKKKNEKKKERKKERRDQRVFTKQYVLKSASVFEGLALSP
jgi:hypothetical protein